MGLVAEHSTSFCPVGRASALTCTGKVPFVEATVADHVVGGNILFPGVGYAEMAFACSGGDKAALAGIAFVRPLALQ